MYYSLFPFVDGVIAQLVERLNGIQKVRSSTLLGSTIHKVFFLLAAADKPSSLQSHD